MGCLHTRLPNTTIRKVTIWIVVWLRGHWFLRLAQWIKCAVCVWHLPGVGLAEERNLCSRNVRTPRELSPPGGKTVGSVVSFATLHTLLSPISDCLQFAWKPLASPLHLQLISSAPQVLSRAPSPLNRGLVILQRSPQKKAPASLRSDHSLLQQVEPPARTDPASPERRARACVRVCVYRNIDY